MALLRYKKDAMAKNNLEQKVLLLLRNLIEERRETDPNYAYKHFSIKRIGRYLLGTGFFHETDEYYAETGFEVEYEYQWDFMDKPETSSRFCAVWTNGKHHKWAPIDFCEAYSPFGENHFFENGCGDRLRVEDVLASQEEVEALVKALCRGKSIDELMDFIEKLDNKKED